MSLLHFRRVERRRTARATMSMNLLVYGDNDEGIFRFWTKSVSVSAYGGVLTMETALSVGQTFQLMNEHNGKKALARIVAVRSVKEGLSQGSFEFVEGGEKFWSMAFPAAGAKPLRRLVRREAQGG
jgi:hypothetical protein